MTRIVGTLVLLVALLPVPLATQQAAAAPAAQARNKDRSGRPGNRRGHRLRRILGGVRYACQSARRRGDRRLGHARRVRRQEAASHRRSASQPDPAAPDPHQAQGPVPVVLDRQRDPCQARRSAAAAGYRRARRRGRDHGARNSAAAAGHAERTAARFSVAAVEWGVAAINAPTCGPPSAAARASWSPTSTPVPSSTTRRWSASTAATSAAARSTTTTTGSTRPTPAATRPSCRATTTATARTPWAPWSATTVPPTRSVSPPAPAGSPPRAASPAAARTPRCWVPASGCWPRPTSTAPTPARTFARTS